MVEEINKSSKMNKKGFLLGRDPHFKFFIVNAYTYLIYDMYILANKLN